MKEPRTEDSEMTSLKKPKQRLTPGTTVAISQIPKDALFRTLLTRRIGEAKGWRIAEIPVNYRPRFAGKSKISGTMLGAILATYYILKTIFRYAFI